MHRLVINSNATAIHPPYAAVFAPWGRLPTVGKDRVKRWGYAPSTCGAVLDHIQTYADSRSFGIAVTLATRMSRA
jgi:hypothetical protein